MKNSMRKVVEVFLSHLTNENTISIRTLDYYRSELFLLLQLMENGGKTEWGDLSYSELKALIQKGNNDGKKEHTAKKKYIKAFFLFLYQNGFIDKTIIYANKRRNIITTQFNK